MKRIATALMGALWLAMTLTSCGGSQASIFYALNPMDVYASAAQKVTQGLRIGVGPVRLPDYLNRPQIVVREGENRLVVDEFHRWGGALEDEILRILTENLGVLLGSDQVRVYADDFGRPDYRVTVSLQRFEGVDNREAQLKASWAILQPRTGDVLKTREGLFRAPVMEPEDYEKIVSAQSEALAALSREIAVDIHRLHSGLW